MPPEQRRIVARPADIRQRSPPLHHGLKPIIVSANSRVACTDTHQIWERGSSAVASDADVPTRQFAEGGAPAIRRRGDTPRTRPGAPYM
jgi:hypothetical protein